MYVLDLDKIRDKTVDQIFNLINAEISKDEDGIEIRGDGVINPEVRGKLGILLTHLQYSHSQLTTVKIHQLNFELKGELTGSRFFLKLLQCFPTVYVKEEIIDFVQSAYRTYQTLNELKDNPKDYKIQKLVLIDSTGHEKVLKDKDAIFGRLTQVTAEKKYFKPNLQEKKDEDKTPYGIKKILASIPDDQVEIDLSGSDFKDFVLSVYRAVFAKLPDHLKALKLLNINLQKLDAMDLGSLIELFPKFKDIYLSKDEVDAIIRENSLNLAIIQDKLKDSLRSGNSIYLVDSDGTQSEYKVQEFSDYLNQKEIALRQEVEKLNQLTQQVLAQAAQLRTGTNNHPFFSKQTENVRYSSQPRYLLGAGSGCVALGILATSLSLLATGLIMPVGVTIGIALIVIGALLLALGGKQLGYGETVSSDSSLSGVAKP